VSTIELAFRMTATEDESFVGRLLELEVTESGTIMAAWINGVFVPRSMFRVLEQLIGEQYLMREAMRIAEARETEDEFKMAKLRVEDELCRKAEAM
jgi:hypothetical protein